MKHLAIIGTAGRGSDAEKLTRAYWVAMLDAARGIIAREGVSRLVSGGAAWADHVAVSIALETGIPLDLFLPGVATDQATALKYHSRFSALMRFDSRAELFRASFLFGNSYSERGSFKDRNLSVANRATYFLAMTFGEGPMLKDGGTRDTVEKMRRQGKKGWHFNLNDLKLYTV